MSTRQQRLSPDVLRKNTTDLTGSKVNLVLQDNTVVLGIVQSMNLSFLELTNMRLKKIRIPIDDIYEVYYDTKE